MGSQEEKDLQESGFSPPLVDPAAERAALGAALAYPMAALQVTAELSASDFASPFHRQLYNAVTHLVRHGRTVDPVTVRAALVELAGVAQDMEVLAQLSADAPPLVMVDETLAAVRAAALRRRIRGVCLQGMAAARSGESAAAVLATMEAKVHSLREAPTRGFAPIGPSAELVLAALTSPTPDDHPPGIPTGLHEFDRLTGGLQRGDLILLAARPSVGKTALALTIAYHVAVECGLSVAVCSLEMSREAIASRLLALGSRTPAHRLLSGRLSEPELAALSKVTAQMAAARLHIDDASSVTVWDIRAKTLRFKARCGLDLLVVDYLQLVGGGGRFENRQLEVSAVSRELKALARTLNAPVLALSQLNRAPERRPDHRPQLADLRDSGSLEQDADVVALLYREELYRATPENQGCAELIVAKHRNGPTGSAHLTFVDSYARFFNPWGDE